MAVFVLKFKLRNSVNMLLLNKSWKMFFSILRKRIMLLDMDNLSLSGETISKKVSFAQEIISYKQRKLWNAGLCDIYQLKIIWRRFQKIRDDHSPYYWLLYWMSLWKLSPLFYKRSNQSHFKVRYERNR